MTTHVLVIDDDNGVTELLTLLLRSHGFDVTAVNCAPEGVDAVREKCPDVVILDLMMPDMDGWAACKAIRAFSTIPIIILSALNDPSLVVRALDQGADDYLTKPTSSGVMVAHINKLIRRTGSLKLTTQHTGPLLSGT